MSDGSEGGAMNLLLGGGSGNAPAPADQTTPTFTDGLTEGQRDPYRWARGGLAVAIAATGFELGRQVERRRK